MAEENEHVEVEETSEETAASDARESTSSEESVAVAGDDSAASEPAASSAAPAEPAEAARAARQTNRRLDQPAAVSTRGGGRHAIAKSPLNCPASCLNKVDRFRPLTMGDFYHRGMRLNMLWSDANFWNYQMPNWQAYTLNASNTCVSPCEVSMATTPVALGAELYGDRPIGAAAAWNGNQSAYEAATTYRGRCD